MLESFSCTGFRNLGSGTFLFAPGITLFSGENGAGKTNIIEAIAVLSGRPSFRNAEPREMAREGSFFLHGTVRREGGKDDVATHWTAGRPRQFARNGEKVTFFDIGEVLPAIFLAPEDRSLFLGSPSARRRFLDRLTVTLYPAASESYDRFRRALAQRNALLSAPSPGREELETWTEEFVRCAQDVAVRRHAACHEWQKRFSARLETAGSLAGLCAESRGEAVEDYPRLARALASRERERGHTLFGPQRDDLEFTRLGRRFDGTASTGEIMRAAFLVRLAEGETAAALRGATPLYALDDFDAELSPAAAESLLANLPGDAQILLTSAHPDAAARCPRRPEALFEVVGGEVYPTPMKENLRKIG